MASAGQLPPIGSALCRGAVIRDYIHLPAAFQGDSLISATYV